MALHDKAYWTDRFWSTLWILFEKTKASPVRAKAACVLSNKVWSVFIHWLYWQQSRTFVSLLILSVQVLSLFGKCYWCLISFSTHVRLKYVWLMKHISMISNDFRVHRDYFYLKAGAAYSISTLAITGHSHSALLLPQELEFCWSWRLSPHEEMQQDAAVWGLLLLH